MKLFWTIIAIFAFAAAGMVWAQARSDQRGPVFARDTGVAERLEQPSGGPIIGSAPVQPDDPESDIDGALPSAQIAGPDETVDDEDKDELAQRLIDDLLDEDAPPMVARTTGEPGHEHIEVQRTENPWEAERAEANGAPLEHSIEKQPDGSILVDGLFTITGDGTKESPYVITWDLLMSAAETYQPRLGMNELPERITMLDGKHVKIAGFLMFPMATFEAREGLVMLNMWDGCCIGTMPSPYDAIEVQFSRGIPASTRQFANYGTLEGKLVVDPYLISDWLIGLYVLEEAALNAGL